MIEMIRWPVFLEKSGKNRLCEKFRFFRRALLTAIQSIRYFVEVLRAIDTKFMPPLKAKSVADAYRLASRVTSLGMGCVTPPLIGYLVDEWQSTKPIGVLIGSLLGFMSLFVQLRQLVRDMAREFPEHKNSR